MKKMILLLAVLVTASVTTQAQDFNGRNDRDRDGYQRPLPVLTDAQFARVLDAVNKTPFNSDKPNAFHLAMRDRRITTAQVAELLKQFSFNDDKLFWAKTAYRYTADRQRFYQLREYFSFISTQREFDQFLLTEAGSRPDRRDRVMGRAEYADLKAAIAKQPFKDDKKNVFRLALQNRLITTTQLRDLLSQFSFDDDKLDWAMLAYDYTSDVNRFYLLRDVLTFDSSKQKLDSFLLSQG